MVKRSLSRWVAERADMVYIFRNPRSGVLCFSLALSTGFWFMSFSGGESVSFGFCFQKPNKTKNE